MSPSHEAGVYPKKLVKQSSCLPLEGWRKVILKVRFSLSLFSLTARLLLLIQTSLFSESTEEEVPDGFFLSSSPRRTRKVRVGPTGLRSRGGRVGTPPLCPLGLPPRPQMTREGAGHRLRRWATPSGDGRGEQWPAGRSGFSFWNAPLRICSKEWRIKEWEQSGAVFLCY